MAPPAPTLFSDLDGTLLDHHDYSYAPALPALDQVRRRGARLVLTTSKTLAEVDPLRRELGLPDPVIVENGAVIAWPEGGEPPGSERLDRISGYAVVHLGPAYTGLRRFITAQRARFGYRLAGFGDMDSREVTHLTGLSVDAADRARQRLGSEPFVWRDDAARLEDFRRAALSQGFALTRGGRFWHLMGPTSKARAMHLLLQQLPTPTPTTTIALGDSENDREMLECADIAVVVRRHDGSHLDCHGKQRTLFTDQPGPAGWNSAVLQLLAELDATHETTREDS